MTDAERKRLNEIAEEASHTLMRDLDQQFLIGLARRLDQLEMIIPTFLTDRAADEDWLVERDCVVRDEAAKMAARECASIAEAARADFHEEATRVNTTLDAGAAIGCNDVKATICVRFALEGAGGPTLTERVTAEVAQQCIEIAEEVALDPEAGDAETVANAIRELFGFTAGVQSDGEYTVRSRFTMTATPTELDAAAGFPADLDEQIGAANAQAHDEPGKTPGQ